MLPACCFSRNTGHTGIHFVKTQHPQNPAGGWRPAIVIIEYICARRHHPAVYAVRGCGGTCAKRRIELCEASSSTRSNSTIAARLASSRDDEYCAKALAPSGGGRGQMYQAFPAGNARPAPWRSPCPAGAAGYLSSGRRCLSDEHLALL